MHRLTTIHERDQWTIDQVASRSSEIIFTKNYIRSFTFK